VSVVALPAAVRAFLARSAPAGGVVAAVSGGPDSVALLRALLAVRAGQRVVIAHVNHGLRGAESDADEAFVRQLHATLTAAGNADLDLQVERIDIAALAAAEAGNREAVARRERYAWLAQVAESCACHVMTGHTADDQAETVLHRLLRGSGVPGLRGIAARRPLTPTVALVRPMLTVSRADVLAYLTELGQPFCQDSSNADTALTRNRIRHELLPALARDYNPAVVRLLAQLAEQADELARTVEALARQLLTDAELPRAGSRLILRPEALAGHPRQLVREALRLAWTREGWSQAGMTFAAWDRLAAVALDDRTAVDLPGGIHARRTGRVVQVGPVW